MMELQYSPHHSHSPTAAAHLLSPTHIHHGSPLNGFSIGQIRRSLSRSPSKPARHHAVHASTAPPSSSSTPVALFRVHNTGTASEPSSRVGFPVRRTGPLRTAPRKTSPSSPLRQALSDNTNSANAAPQFSWRFSAPEDQENMDCSEDSPAVPPELSRFDEPIKLNLHKADRLLQPAKQDLASPMKSSPLKRSDGVMNLEAATTGSPSHKRRSLHGALGNDFNIFDFGMDGTQSDPAESSDEKEQPTAATFSTWPSPATNSPQKRPTSLRKSALHSRSGAGRSRLFHDGGRDHSMSPALTRARSRISLDSALPFKGFDFDSPSHRSQANEPPVLFAPPTQKPSQSAPKPHPLSHALTPSSSANSVTEDHNRTVQKPATSSTSFSSAYSTTPHVGFSKSLPIGAARPAHQPESSNGNSSQESFATPAGYKMAKPLPQAFMSTGLISKRNRNLDMPPAAFTGSINMPDTPSKKAHILLDSTPAPSASGKLTQPLHGFDSPTTPFYGRTSKVSPGSFAKGANIFGSHAGAGLLIRRGSVVSVDGEEPNNSPIHLHQFESQSSNDDLPPTPTKSTSTSTRPPSRGKSNSLRSSLFGRRTSLAPDTFASPAAEESASLEHIDSKHAPYLYYTPCAKTKMQHLPFGVDDSPTPLITLTTTCAASPSLMLGRSRSLPAEQFPTSPTPAARRSLHSLPPALDVPFVPAFTKRQLATASISQQLPLSQQGDQVDGLSPHTPHESFTPPDPSSLSISAENRPRTSFGLSHSSIFPPATPTAPRVDQGFGVSVGPGHASSSYFANEVDTALSSRFAQVTTLGIGEFSQVYKVEAGVSSAPSGYAGAALTIRPPGAHFWAVKKTRKPYTGNRDRQRKMREVKILRALRGHEHLVEFVDYWEAKNNLYIQTQFYENGNLKDFLLQTGFKGRLDDFRIWKILLELCQGVKSIHDAQYIHLDLKPANIFIDWEGVLKIGDFGMASAWPAPLGLDGEGDREYIGPEVLSGRFDKPADIFALGMILLEIAGNIVLPDNGSSWQRLRAGDLSDLPSLTFSSDSSLARDDESADPVDPSSDLANGFSTDSLCTSHADATDDDDDDDLSFLRPTAFHPSGPYSAAHAATCNTARTSGPISVTPKPKTSPSRLDRSRDLVTPPNFMIDPSDPGSLDRIVLWMIHPDPDRRPTVDQLLSVAGVAWVDARRRAGATVFEGAWGPSDEVLNSALDGEEGCDVGGDSAGLGVVVGGGMGFQHHQRHQSHCASLVGLEGGAGLGDVEMLDS